MICDIAQGVRGDQMVNGGLEVNSGRGMHGDYATMIDCEVKNDRGAMTDHEVTSDIEAMSDHEGMGG